MRDPETTSAAITAGETGHLVMATLHTNDAVQAIDRIIDVFPPHQQPQVRSQLAAALLGVISQRLLLRADEAGRVAAFEVLVCTTAMQALIREGKMHQAMAMMETKRAEGMFTLDHSIKRLFEAGEISAQEAYRYLRNPKIITS
jgi:twitching motility protein PilT